MPHAKTVLITGASGFIGHHLIERFGARTDIGVIAAARRCEHEYTSDRIQFVAADLAEPGSAVALVRRSRPDCVVHAAGRNAGNKTELWRDNAEAGHLLLDAIEQEAPAAHVIVFGSAAEYGNPSDGDRLAETAVCRPVSSYGHAKLAVTENAMARYRQRGLAVTVLRLFNIVGPGIGAALALGAFLDRAAAADSSTGTIKVRMGRLDGVRDYVPLTHLVKVVECIVARQIVGEIINVCTGRGRTFGELIARLGVLTGNSIEVEGDANLFRPEVANAVVGNPDKCIRLTGVISDGDLDASLIAAWKQAMDGDRTRAA